MPYTSEGFSLAASLCDRLSRLASVLPEDAVERLAEVQGRVRGALVFFRPGGLFTSYSHFDPDADWLPIPPAHLDPPQSDETPRQERPDSDRGLLPGIQVDANWVNVGGVRLRRRPADEGQDAS